jgi:putative ABC transport system substrate-binding protein
MRRRKFITLLGGAAAAWPLVLRAQQSDKVKRVAVMMAYAESDPEGQLLLHTFVGALEKFGWKTNHNLILEYRWAGGDVDLMRSYARELVALQPDIILANTTPVIAAFQRETRTIPIVFVIAADPIGDGFVASLNRPRGNITGFLNLEGSMGGKWLELLKEIAPQVRRVAMMFNPDTSPDRGDYYAPALDAAAQAFGIESLKAPVRNDSNIEEAIASLAIQPAGGLVVASDGFVRVHRHTIIAAAARHKIPTVYPLRVNVADGGLLAYGPSYVDLFRQVATYIDRILGGANPGELPVQVPTKFEFVINLKTAKALGLNVPPTLLARADEVIE